MLCYVGLFFLHLLSLLVMTQVLSCVCKSVIFTYFYFEQVCTIYVAGFGYDSYGD